MTPSLPLQRISQLVQEVSTRENALLPKKKFAFKSRKKDSQLPTTGVNVEEKGKKERGGGPGGGGGGGGGGGDGGGGGRGHVKLENIVGFTDKKDEKLLMSVSSLCCTIAS